MTALTWQDNSETGDAWLFYSGQRIEIVIAYCRSNGQPRTAGMSESDIVEAITKSYGPASLPSGMEVTVPARYGTPDSPGAVWGNPGTAPV